MKKAINNFFQLKQLNTDIQTEVIAGFTTFMTMAYIIFVNPAMISQTGMDFGSGYDGYLHSRQFFNNIDGLICELSDCACSGHGPERFFYLYGVYYDGNSLAGSFGLLSVIFIFLFMDIFDTVGTLAGVGELGGFIKAGKFPRVGKAMLTDAFGTCIGAACGTPTVTSYIESASGIATGGRSGLVSVVTGLLFLLALFFSPLIRMIGGGFVTQEGATLHPVTAPALIIVGSMMLHSITKIDWKDYIESIPAFLVIIMMPLTFSIASGIAVGFISFAALKLFTGRRKEVSWLVYILAGLFILRFIYLQAR